MSRRGMKIGWAYIFFGTTLWQNITLFPLCLRGYDIINAKTGEILQESEKNMKTIKSFLTKNRCYQAGKKITVKGLMLHSVGCPQPSAEAFVSSWDNAQIEACVHAFIDGNTGDVYQTLPWNHRGWHCASGSKGSGNNTHIGVEMCEPASIKYTGGANFTCSDPAAAKEVVKRTYNAAVELFASLCDQYGLDPLADGVIISHREGHARGIASNHGDPEHLWTRLGTGYTMDSFRKAVSEAMEGRTSIMGEAVATSQQMIEYIKAVNPEVPQSVLDMIPLYLSEGIAEGVRGDIAFAQSCLETGNFTFRDTAVTLDQNNFCGMGVTEKGMRGNSFATPQIGIQAQVQHLKAYATADPLAGVCVDPRYKWVEKGCASYVEWLGQKENPSGKGWAAGEGYGRKILGILEKITGVASASPTVPFLVKVADLDIFPAPPSGKTGIGTFTITEVQNGWGRLKSGAGWINVGNL